MDKLCQNCQAPLAADAPRGLCPACLMKVAMATGTVAGPEKPGFTPPSTQDLGLKFPQLEIIELIGRGGMGAVYKARQKELDRIVALKILPPGIGDDAAFAERFAREAKALARLNHPGIVTIHDFGRADGLYFFVMEFVDGVSLRQLLASGRVSPREALAIVPQICDAPQYAHDQGIVHRDIKPENILLDRRGRVKVADFGLAKIVEGGAGSPLPADPRSGTSAAAHGVARPTSELTEAGKVMGTPAYMAPEQVGHPAEVDHRADIYALGVVFYQMLTGELPGKPIVAPSSKVHIDVRLDEVVLRALEKNPELRYQQVSEVKTVVESISSSSSPVTGTAPSPARPAATRGRLRVALLVGVLVWLCGTGTVTLITWIRAKSWKVVAVISCPHNSWPGRPVNDHFKFIATMIELIRSDVILGRVIDRLNLDERSGRLDERWGKRNIGLKLTKAQAMVLLKRRLDVRSEGGTLIQVGVFGKRPEEPEEAMDIANTIGEELRAFRLEQHDSPAEVLEITLRYTAPDILLGIAAGFVLGLLAGGLVLLFAFLRRGSQASQVKKGVEAIVGSAGDPPAEPGLATSLTNRIPPAEKTVSSRPLALMLVSVVLVLLGAYSVWDMAYNTHYLARKFVPTIFCLPVGIGLLRLRFLWRRCALAGVWCGYTLLLFILSVVFAKANGLTLLQGTTPMEFFGWKLNAIQATWVGLINFLGCAALLAWLHAVLMRPQVEVLFEQQRGRGAGWLETLVVIWLVLFAFAWIPQKAQTSSAPAHLTAPTGENLSFGPVIERLLGDESQPSTKSMIDLDDGRLVSPPPGTGLTDPWLARNGVDCVASTSQTNHGLWGINLRAFADVGSEEWKEWTPDVVWRMTLGYAAKMPPQSPVSLGAYPQPTTFLFQTREGSIGILQITDVTDTPRGVKIRYKLVRGPKATPPFAPSLAPAAGQPEATFGPAYGHEQEFLRQLAESIPVREYGYTIKELMFTDDYRKALVVFTHTNDQARLSQDNRQRRPDREFTLDSNGFRRYRGFAMQPFYTPGSANTPPIYITVVLPDK
jgi:serine/threonine protein kinase